jgi:tetratricopeptide (TPR) repeat protein
MKQAISCFVILFLASCAIKKVETAKVLYMEARASQERGEDLLAIAKWKAVADQSGKEIESGKYPNTNRILRASAYVELGEWDRAFDDLKNIKAEELRDEELWIYPMYSILMGDYFAQQSMPSIAENFYQSILKKSALKSSSMYLLALERHVNNSIQVIQQRASAKEDPEKQKLKEYEALTKEIEKYVEEFPGSSVPHFLMADLLYKQKNANEAIEHFIASIELGLPTKDLKKTAEFEIASILTNYEISPALQPAILKRAQAWWATEITDSFFRAGESTADWLLKQEFIRPPQGLNTDSSVRIRYLGLSDGEKLKILLWEKL